LGVGGKWRLVKINSWNCFGRREIGLGLIIDNLIDEDFFSFKDSY
jgi:hypothetical protein